jgi:hypothetical protein
MEDSGMTAFTPDQWFILAMVFVLGLVLGMALLASPKWKRRYREEVARREAVEAENAQLRRDSSEMDSLRSAAARDEARRRDDLARPLVRDEVVRRDEGPGLLAREEARLRDERSAPLAGDGVGRTSEAEALRDEADRVETNHPGEAESLRRAAARDEVRRTEDDRGLLSRDEAGRRDDGPDPLR